MPQLRASYDPAVGPLIDGEIGYPVSLLQAGTPSLSMPVRFLIDTGSARTFVSPAVVSQLSLQWVSRRSVWCMSGQIDVDIYAGDLLLTGLASFAGIELYQIPSINPLAQYEGIIGRDVFNGSGAVRLDGRTKEYTVTF